MSLTLNIHQSFAYMCFKDLTKLNFLSFLFSLILVFNTVFNTGIPLELSVETYILYQVPMAIH